MSGKYTIAVNMEFVRSADKSFVDGVKIAADLGYKYIEPMVHTGWELLSEVNYFHSFSMEEDPLLMKEICDVQGIKVGSLSGHSPLMKPEAAIPRLTRAIVLADAVGAKFVNTDEMVKPDWMTDEESKWLEELFTSPSANIYINGAWEPVIILSTEYQQMTSARNGMFQHEVTIQFANDKNIQRG